MQVKDLKKVFENKSNPNPIRYTLNEEGLIDNITDGYMLLKNTLFDLQVTKYTLGKRDFLEAKKELFVNATPRRATVKVKKSRIMYECVQGRTKYLSRVWYTDEGEVILIQEKFTPFLPDKMYMGDRAGQVRLIDTTDGENMSILVMPVTTYALMEDLKKLKIEEIACK